MDSNDVEPGQIIEVSRLEHRFERVFDRLCVSRVSPDVAAQVALALVTEEDDAAAREGAASSGPSGGGVVPPGAEAT